MLQPDGLMAKKNLSELGVKRQGSVHVETFNVKQKRRIIPVISAVHEVRTDDIHMKVMDHNYYVQENWEDYEDDIAESFMEMICRKISDMLH